MKSPRAVWRGLAPRALAPRALALCALALAAADLLGRGLGLGAWGGQNPGCRRVALTFDDGPSAQTPELLRVLDHFGVRATFFVTEPACRAFGAQWAELRRSGHQLEAHGRWHRHALLLTPGQEWAQVRWHPRGREGQWYRPPYGGHSPLTRLLTALAGRRVALWDAESRDWRPQQAPLLASDLLTRLRGGEVVLLHDGPAVTPELLRDLLAGVQARGWQAVALDDLPARRIGWRAAWGRLRASYGG